jgi:putative transposase
MGKPMELGGVYHLTDHAVDKNNVFTKPDNYFYFLSRYEHFVFHLVDTYAYCLMPNHFHVAIKVKTRNTILELPPELLARYKLSKDSTDYEIRRRVSQQFSNLFNGYTQAFNKQEVRRGALFEGNFCRSKVNDADYFRSMILYIHGNAVHHGFCEHYMEWAYSSIHPLLYDSEPTFLRRDILFDFFGGKEKFIEAHDTWKPTHWDNDF